MIKKKLVKAILRIRECGWGICALYYRWRVRHKTLPGIPYNNLLVLAPHSDDEWIGCSCLIRGEKSVVICNMNKPGGDSETIHHQRVEEMKSMSELFGKKYVSIKDNDVNELLGVILKYKPEAIMIPFFFDWHTEHQEVMDTLYDVVVSNPRVFDNIAIGMYQVSIPIRLSVITHYIGMEGYEFKRKWELFKDIYQTQQHIPYKRFSAYERIHGAIGGSYAAEVYSFMSALKWKDNRSILRPDHQEVKLIKEKINNIHFIYSYINRDDVSY